MGRKGQDIKITLKFPEGRAKEVKDHINKILVECYASAIIDKVKESVPEKGLLDAVTAIEKALKEK